MKQHETRWKPGDTPLMEYPRPQLKRGQYEILNGYWDYAITKSAGEPSEWQGRILVPYSPECSLSGVGEILHPYEYLHYRRILYVRKPRRGRVLLNFEAVDQYAEVYVNGALAGRHMGGYSPFTFDITDLVSDGPNFLHVSVLDSTDSSYHSRGKQAQVRGGMFYSCQSGIWQTVWMEYVPDLYIRDLKITPDIDRKCVRLTIFPSRDAGKEAIVSIIRRGRVILMRKMPTGEDISLPMESMELWTPESPSLYSLKVELGNDHVDSYFGMRKFSVGMDARGIRRFMLNNKPYFANGVLDQGYWPESLMTPPSDEAYICDIRTMKDLGFNMLRKHVKVEGRRWYYHCDRMGMLVWQDMVNGGSNYNMNLVRDMANILTVTQRHFSDCMNYKILGRESERGRREYRHELAGMLRELYNSTCICTWVPFNEGWGQFEAAHMADFIARRDPTRTVDHASGWYDEGAGDYFSIHNYFFPLRIEPKNRVVALTEFGGTTYPVSGHRSALKTYGYGLKVYSKKDLTRRYEHDVRREVLSQIKKGMSASVYTQLSDIEEEMNGLVTGDREVVKVEPERVRSINRQIITCFEHATT
ncbi:MAG: sugar-binding domain-containing protein [Lachnospiraceae bacterium]|nr:sugar-binding domain-containing protein [Lachnospiraceae bacterium]